MARLSGTSGKQSAIAQTALRILSRCRSLAKSAAVFSLEAGAEEPDEARATGAVDVEDRVEEEEDEEEGEAEKGVLPNDEEDEDEGDGDDDEDDADEEIDVDEEGDDDPVDEPVG